jgi:hypothetical protein
MKRIAFVATIWIFVATLAGSLALAQDAPLGDYARQARKQKGRQAPAAKTFDNDNLPKDDKLSVVGQAPTEAADSSTPAGNVEAAPAAGDAAAPATSAPASGQSDAAAQAAAPADKKPAEDEQAQKQKAFKEWQTRIQAQRDQVDMMTREIDVSNREYRLRAAAFYADAGNRLRNAGAWDKEDAQYKDQLADKQKKLDEAKKQLEDMQEQARKAGVPSSMRE